SETNAILPPDLRGKPVAAAPPGANPLGANPLAEEFRKKERAYHELVARYTSKHPDVLRAKGELERLRAEVPPEDLIVVDRSSAAVPSAVAEVGDSNPLYLRLNTQLREIKTEIDIREKERLAIDREIALYSRRVQNTPRAE